MIVGWAKMRLTPEKWSSPDAGAFEPMMAHQGVPSRSHKPEV